MTFDASPCPTRRALLRAAALAAPALAFTPARAETATAAAEAGPSALMCGGCELFIAPHGCRAMAAPNSTACKRSRPAGET